MKPMFRICIFCLLTGFSLLPPALTAQGLHLSNGGHLILSGPVKMVLHNANLTLNGQFTPGAGTLLFTGNDDAYISSPFTIPFHHLGISKSPGSRLSLQLDCTVYGEIAMNGGIIDLHDHTLFLGPAGYLSNESNQSHITGAENGRIMLTRHIKTPLNQLDPGNIGIELSSDAAPGLFVVERKHGRIALPSGISIQRNFNIVSSTTTGLNASVRFYYLEAELGNNNESGLVVWRDATGSNTWVPGTHGNDVVNNWVALNNLDSWGRFTLGAPEISMLRKPGANNATDENSKPAPLAFPNPAGNHVTIQWHNQEEKIITVRLTDPYGRMLEQKKVAARAGWNQLRWNLGSYAKGVYFIVIENGETKPQKIIKQ